MEDVIMKVVQELVDYVSSGHQFEEKQIKSDWERDAHKFHNGILISDEPSEIKLDFFSLNYRKAPSISSAHSSNGNEQGDISDSELPFLVSDEDSDKEFERIQQFTLEARYNTFKREHPDGNPLHKVPKRETQLVSDDFYHDYDDLPPLDGLTIHCEDNIPMEPVGHVTSIVDCLVVIQSDNGVALDIDSVLFDKERNSIGVVYDLFGPVRNPLYSVRFNTKEEASKINVGMEVYFAPLAEQYTKTVIATAKNDLQSDDDVSLDDEPLFSDDEKEKEYRARKMAATKSSVRVGKQGSKSVQFSDSTNHRDVWKGVFEFSSENKGSRTNTVRGKSWNWHNKRGCTQRGRAKRRHNRNAETSHSGESDNPYSEFGCYSRIPFTDSRKL
ncbi:NAF1 domain protein [Dictyocaulus viviparus]|uniref:H/ACA ribonucleoprotein complex non-core subunit NAF1 n=1 Tax=Dictyocaulus viviparus TaxID=29172 RepID=A0A0D8XXB0_DICVI|nr:NAF1 domain protein [Dictyocaulus viviparus]